MSYSHQEPLKKKSEPFVSHQPEKSAATTGIAQRITGKPDKVSKRNVLELQRTIGNKAVAQLIKVQRSIATETATGHVCTSGCTHNQVARHLETIAPAQSTPTTATHEAVQRDALDDKLEAYNHLQPDLDAYTKRSGGKSKTDFAPEKLDPASRAYAFSLPRKPDGTLSDEAIQILTAKEASDAKTMITDKYAGFGVTDNRTGWFKDRRLKKTMDKDKNTVSGKTRLPDLANVLNPNKETDAPLTATIDVGGVAMPVTYNKSDVNFPKRLALLAQGVERVRAKGFTVPALNVQVPKYSRGITINSDCTVTIGNTTSAAQYAAPNLMHMGSSGLDNPQEATREKPGTTTGERELNFTSAQVDPSGVGTVVHELGHALHFSMSPGKFLELSLTSFKGNGAAIANKVSGYAANTREFVAEVFLGLIYDKAYDDDVIQMYIALGGPMSAAFRAQTRTA